MELHKTNIPESVVNRIPEDVARRDCVIAIACSPNLLTVAHPNDKFTKAARFRTEREFVGKVIWEPYPREEIQAAIDRHYIVAAGVESCETKFRFQCPHRWKDFALTDNKEIRFCPVCTHNVYLCLDEDSARRNAELGHCIVKRDSLGFELTGVPMLPFQWPIDDSNNNPDAG